MLLFWDFYFAMSPGGRSRGFMSQRGFTVAVLGGKESGVKTRREGRL
jgi:hypothetical protein